MVSLRYTADLIRMSSQVHWAYDQFLVGMQQILKRALPLQYVYCDFPGRLPREESCWWCLCSTVCDTHSTAVKQSFKSQPLNASPSRPYYRPPESRTCLIVSSFEYMDRPHRTPFAVAFALSSAAWPSFPLLLLLLSSAVAVAVASSSQSNVISPSTVLTIFLHT